VSVSQIARTSGLDRKTVRRALAQAAWQPYRRAPAGQTLLSGVGVAPFPWRVVGLSLKSSNG
jgi:hypothetical protein